MVKKRRKTENIEIKIDSNIKKKAEKFFKTKGLTLADAIKLFLAKSILENTKKSNSEIHEIDAKYLIEDETDELSPEDILSIEVAIEDFNNGKYKIFEGKMSMN